MIQDYTVSILRVKKMDFKLSEDIKPLKQNIRDFIDSVVDPLAMEIE